ncbi:hypothetical protein LAJ19_08280 [Deinococcus taeanensis]|uniref:hypothetical protein n=1 Tax=Deinococcus taeanensis TaxID=2737050 RepID=UPI001CDCB6CF|nr:hypothetical protein [Deinococcus taeanensis]UBV41657.1 hypothetical protein LAJ19_08280 [Deinococcus taeanensis]
MPALAYIFCESCAAPETGSDWTGEARFLMDGAQEFLTLLERAGLANLGHPDVTSLQVSAETLFEDGEIIGRTTLTAADLATLLTHAPPEQHPRLLAWAAFAYALEGQGQAARLLIWFVR